MREDSEVIAQARAAMSVPPALEPAEPEPFDDDVPPIIVPGRGAGVLPGIVPPPPVPGTGWAPTPAVDAADGDWSPRLRRRPAEATGEAGLEQSAEVSAVAGSPEAGSPRSASAAVSAQQAAAEAAAHEAAANEPADEDFDEATQLAVRRRTTVWTLGLPMGRSVELTGTVVLLGRRPDAGDSDAQLVPVQDGTRTVSKTHARLELLDGSWHIVDLDSTNGVVLLGADGGETEIAPQQRVALTERFLLGDAEFTLAGADPR